MWKAGRILRSILHGSAIWSLLHILNSSQWTLPTTSAKCAQLMHGCALGEVQWCNISWIWLHPHSFVVWYLCSHGYVSTYQCHLFCGLGKSTRVISSIFNSCYCIQHEGHPGKRTSQSPWNWTKISDLHVSKRGPCTGTGWEWGKLIQGQEAWGWSSEVRESVPV